MRVRGGGSTSSSDALLRIAVVGAGSIGREFALRHFGPHTLTTVASIIDINASAAEQLAIDVGSVAAGAHVTGGGYRETASDRRGTPVEYATSLTDAILAKCDAVYIGTTPSSHSTLVLRALASDKHVLLEKPLASTAQDADTIVEAAAAARARGVHVSMNIGMRYNAALREMRRLTSSGALGELQSAKLELHFARWPREWQQVTWCNSRQDGGPLREVGTHFLFAIHELFGHGCVQRARAVITYGTPGSSETAAEGTLELANGLQITLGVTTDGSVCGAARDIYQLVVTGRDGALVLDSFTTLRRIGAQETTLVKPGPYGRTECVEAFVAAIRETDVQTTLAVKITPGGSTKVDGQLPPEAVSVEEGRNAQRVLDALLRSSGEWQAITYE